MPLLRFSLPRSPDVIAAFLRARVLRPDSEVWLTGLNALRWWVEDKLQSVRAGAVTAVNASRRHDRQLYVPDRQRAGKAPAHAYEKKFKFPSLRCLSSTRSPLSILMFS